MILFHKCRKYTEYMKKKVITPYTKSRQHLFFNVQYVIS